MSRYVLPIFLASCLLLTGCYQARMTTGKEPSNTVVEKGWAPSFIYGLVPARVDVSQECPNGIASAERKFSFPNLLVNTLTLGIYLPQSVTVTCAAEGSMSAAAELPAQMTFTLPEDATRADVRETVDTAALQSSLTQTPARIRVTAE